MKKLTKKLLSIGLAAGLSAAGVITSYAGQWQENGGRWWYLEDDGSYPSNTWRWIDGKCYYFDSQGWMLQNTVAPDGSKVGSDGAWIDTSDYFNTDVCNEYLKVLEDSRRRTEELNRSDYDGEFNYSYFSFLDINKDGIKELIIYEGNMLGAGSETAKIYTYRSGELISMGETGTTGVVVYNQADDVLASIYSHNSWMEASAYKVREKRIDKLREEYGVTMVEDIRGLPDNQGYYELVDRYVKNMPVLNKVENNRENWDKYIEEDTGTGFNGIADWDN